MTATGSLPSSGSGDAPRAARPALPRAVITVERRTSWAWLAPLLALLFAGYLGWQAWTLRGERVVVLFNQGHGLKVGDEVRHRGIVVGRVEHIDLVPSLEGVQVTVTLRSHAGRIARQGTQFWIVRPRIGPSGVTGLDTVVGPRWIAVKPGDDPAADPRREFVGLPEPPVVEEVFPGDLEVVLQAKNRGSLQPGGPVMYRQVRVGTVLSVGLASDGSAVEARVHIEQAYAALVRERTRFWDSGGAKFNVGITGVSMEMDSLASLMIGGVSLATPRDGGQPVRTGHRFTCAPEPLKEWLEWDPAVPIGSALLPPGAPVPTPERARLAWREGRVFRSTESRTGWVLPVEGGLIGPADLLKPAADARAGTASLEVAGQSVPLVTPAWERGEVAMLPSPAIGRPWPRSAMRRPDAPEDCLIVADGAAAPIPLAAARLSSRSGSWRIDEAIGFDASMHGACVLSRTDGALVGFLLVDRRAGRVALLPAEYP